MHRVSARLLTLGHYLPVDNDRVPLAGPRPLCKRDVNHTHRVHAYGIEFISSIDLISTLIGVFLCRKQWNVILLLICMGVHRLVMLV